MTAGPSGGGVKTTAAKLLIKPGVRVWVDPPELLRSLGPLPPGVMPSADLPSAGVAILFFSHSTDLRLFIGRHPTALLNVPVLWICYPKGGASDLSRDTLWPMLAAHHLRPITQVAIDGYWSALRFRPLKPGEPPFMGGAAAVAEG